MKIEVTEHKSVGSLRFAGNRVRVFVNGDVQYGYFIDEHFLFDLLTAEQQTQYLSGSSDRFDVNVETAQKIIDNRHSPYKKKLLS